MKGRWLIKFVNLRSPTIHVLLMYSPSYITYVQVIGWISRQFSCIILLLGPYWTRQLNKSNDNTTRLINVNSIQNFTTMGQNQILLDNVGLNLVI